MSEVKLVCNLCGKDWKLNFNPGECPNCKKPSFGIVVKVPKVEVKELENA